MRVTPTPTDIRLIQDVYSNSVAMVQPQSPASELKVVCSFSVEHFGTRTLDFALSPRVQNFPFDYDAEEQRMLAPYRSPYSDDPGEVLRTWARQFTGGQRVIGTRDLLLAMTQFIGYTLQ